MKLNRNKVFRVRMDKLFSWSEIGSVPDKPGIYAWYYLPEITDFDLEWTIKRLCELRDRGDRKSATEETENFFEKAIFRYFQEAPFLAELKGPLKPHYEGVLDHKPSISPPLVDRIIEEPERLYTIKEVLEASAPGFSRPIYIGMSGRLRTRVGHHKKLIEHYRENSPPAVVDSTDPPSIKHRDQNFAQMISVRNIVPSRLSVVVRIIGSTSHRYVDLENILNRIHYPLLGRN